MISSAQEFILLRQSESKLEYDRATIQSAALSVWKEIITQFPEFKIWVIHNKTIQLEILEFLCNDPDPKVRGAVARKRKINDFIFSKLSNDPDENVRYDLMCNTNISIEKKQLIKTNNSTWLAQKLAEALNK